MYYVTQYEESPVEPRAADQFQTLAEARREAERRCDGGRDTTLRGERYEDGTRHVEAHYHDEHGSSGVWITEDV